MIQQSELLSRYRKVRSITAEPSGVTERSSDDMRTYRAVAELLDDPAHPLRAAAYRYPVSHEELLAGQEGLHSLAGGESVFAGGWADYAHALLASWHTLREHERLAGRFREDRLAHWFTESRRSGAVVTTSLQPVRSGTASGQAASAAAYTEEGIVLSGSQTFGEDVLFADELLLLLHEAGGRGLVTVALVRADDPQISYRAHPELESLVLVWYEAVTIPWSRVLVDRSGENAAALLNDPVVSSYAAYRWLARQIGELELAVGTLFAVAEKSDLHKQLAAQGELAEAIQGLETIKALLEASGLQADRMENGAVIPAHLPLRAAKRAFGPAFRLALQLLERFSAAWLLHAPAASAGRTEEEAGLLQWVQSLTTSRRALHRSLHEQYAFGDSAAQSAALFECYPLEPLKERYRSFWRQHAN